MTTHAIRIVFYSTALAFLATVDIGSLSPCFAETLRFRFEGDVSFVDDRFTSVFSTSQSLTGFYEYDITQPDANPDPTIGDFFADVTVALQIGDYIENGRGSVLIRSGQSARDDSFISRSLARDDRSLLGFDLNLFSLRFAYARGTILPTDALKLEPPDLASLDVAEWSLTAEVESNVVRAIASGPLTSVILVPEPDTSSNAMLVLASTLCMAPGRHHCDPS